MDQASNSDDTGRRKVLGTFVRFGSVGPNVIEPDDDIILIVSPQNVVGAKVQALAFD
jgi:hypothetical protein